jgi:hypothetical protein
MNLVEELMSRGYRLRHEGSGNYRVLGHGGLVVKDNYWYSHSKGKGGESTTLLNDMVSDYDGPDRPYHCNQSFAESDHDPEWKKSYHPLNIDATNYLLRRGVPLSLMRHKHVETQRLIFYDGRGYLCFMGYDEQGLVKCISKRAIDSTLNIQRYEEKGSDKGYSFHIPPIMPSNVAILVEGPIDALSVASLENIKYGKGFFYTHKIATCGAPASTIRQRILKLKCDHVVLAFDQDAAGGLMTEKVAEKLRDLNIKITKARPGVGKDPNDWLKHRLQMT